MRASDGRLGVCSLGAECDGRCCGSEDPREGHYVTVYVSGHKSQEDADKAVSDVLAGALDMARHCEGDDPECWDAACDTVVGAVTGPEGDVTMDVVPD